MCNKAQATKSTDSCHSIHYRWGNWRYDVWKEWGRQCDVNHIADILANSSFEEVSAVIAEDIEQFCSYFADNIYCNEQRASNKRRPLISAAPSGNHIETSASPLINAAPLNTALIRVVTMFY